MNKLSAAIKQLEAADEAIYELEEINQTLLNACGMFITWNAGSWDGNIPNGPTFPEVQIAITEAFETARGE